VRVVTNDTSTAGAADSGAQPGDRSVIPVMRPWLGAEEANAAAEAVRSGWVAQGPRVTEFEAAFAAHLGAGHAVATSSCTTALHLAMVLADLGPGDEVVVPSLSFIATANAPRYVQATPVFADVDLSTQNLTAETVEAVLTAATRAVIVVHQGGAPADIDAIRRLCRPREIDVIEDAACALGSTCADRPVGAAAELATYSFHPRKLVTTGEGGMLLCDSPERSDRARRLREHGMSVSAAERHRIGEPVQEHYLETGFNFRMTDVQAAIGLVQLGRLSAMVARRRQLARRYSEAFGDLPGVVTAADPPHGTSNFQSYWLLLPPDAPIGQSGLLEALSREGISARRGIMAAHREPAFAGHPHIPLPVTERLTDDSVILPLYHTMSLEDQDRVIDAVRRQLGG
jgi:dTDP-4-amino-4,6-dideoxygalactose transaminase